MSDLFNVAAEWIYVHRRVLTASVLAVLAGGGAAYLIAAVLGRLDRGGRGRDAVGTRLTGAAVLLIITLAAATNAAMEFANGGVITAGANGPSVGLRELIARIARQLHPADYAYMSAILTLALGAALWHYRRRRWPERVGNPDTSKLLFRAGSVLFVTLWIFQRGVDRFAVDPADVSAPQLVGTLIGAGLLAMAIIQGLRTLLPLRGVFHRVSLERWIDDGLPKLPWRQKRNRRIRRGVIRLARGPALADQYALLDLPIEQLCGQIAAGADRLLDAPFPATLASRSPRPAAAVAEVLMGLSAGGAKEIDRYLQLADKLVPAPTDEDVQSTEAVQAQSTAEARSRGSDAPADGAADVLKEAVVASKAAKPAASPDEAQEFLRLRTTISQRIQRNIDGLQIATTFWWRRVVRSVAFTVSGVIGLSVFSGSITYSVMCAIVGGFVATVSRDLVAIVEKGRR